MNENKSKEWQMVELYVQVSIFVFVLIVHVFVDSVEQDRFELLFLLECVSRIFAFQHENISLIDNNYKFDEIHVKLHNLHLLGK